MTLSGNEMITLFEVYLGVPRTRNHGDAATDKLLKKELIRATGGAHFLVTPRGKVHCEALLFAPLPVEGGWVSPLSKLEH